MQIALCIIIKFYFFFTMRAENLDDIQITSHLNIKLHPAQPIKCSDMFIN